MPLRRRIGWLDLDRGAVQRWRGKRREPTERRLGSRNGVLSLWSADSVRLVNSLEQGSRIGRWGKIPTSTIRISRQRLKRYRAQAEVLRLL
jgi:hypothetical protein